MVFKHNPTVLRGVFQEPWEPQACGQPQPGPGLGTWVTPLTLPQAPIAALLSPAPQTRDTRQEPKNALGGQGRPWSTSGPFRVLLPVCDVRVTRAQDGSLVL